MRAPVQQVAQSQEEDPPLLRILHTRRGHVGALIVWLTEKEYTESSSRAKQR
jgi:hypothetical protein